MTSVSNRAEITRRQLQFSSLDDVGNDARSLLQSGYHRYGQWNLAQVCGHLANWISYPLDGFPKSFPPIGILLGIMRVTVGKKQLKKILDSRSMTSGAPTIPKSVPTVDAASDNEAVARLDATIKRFKEHSGHLHASPIFGEMDKETLTQLHLIHCAHHLSFLVPRS